MDKKYHWYTSKEDLYLTDVLTVIDYGVSNHYGFEKEPSYEVIEKYDLRKVQYSTLDELFNRYF